MADHIPVKPSDHSREAQKRRRYAVQMFGCPLCGADKGTPCSTDKLGDNQMDPAHNVHLSRLQKAFPR